MVDGLTVEIMHRVAAEGIYLSSYFYLNKKKVLSLAS